MVNVNTSRTAEITTTLISKQINALRVPSLSVRLAKTNTTQGTIHAHPVLTTHSRACQEF